MVAQPATPKQYDRYQQHTPKMQEEENETMDIQPTRQHQGKQQPQKESQKPQPRQQQAKRQVMEQMKSVEAHTPTLDSCVAAAAKAALVEKRPSAGVSLSEAVVPSTSMVQMHPSRYASQQRMQTQESEMVGLEPNQQVQKHPQQAHDMEQSEKPDLQQHQVGQHASEKTAGTIVRSTSLSVSTEAGEKLRALIATDSPHFGNSSSERVVEIDVSQLIESDPDQIASAAANKDEDTLRTLEGFAGKLHASVKRIMNAKAKERRIENQARSRDGKNMEDNVKQAKSLRVGQHAIAVGEHVWVLNGKQYHAAIIKSLPTEIETGEMATIQWDSTKTCSEVELHPDVIRPMHVEQENGECVSSSFSRRNRRKREQYIPSSTEEDQMLAKAIKISRSEKQDRKKVFSIGDQVEAKYKGRSKSWSAGTVVDVLQHDRYNIEYFDGGGDGNLSRHHIRSVIKNNL